MRPFLLRGFNEVRSWREWRLSTKLMILLLVGALLAIFAISKQNELRSTALLTQEQSKLLTALANTVAIQVNSQVLQYRAQAVEVATDPEVISFLQMPPEQQAQTGGGLLKRLHPILAANPDYRLLLLLDRAGQVVISDEPGVQGLSYADQDFFSQGLLAEASQPFIADISLAEDRRSQITYVSYPIRDPVGKELGVAAIRLAPDHVAEPLRAADLRSEGRQGFLVNRQGVVLANSATPTMNYRVLGSLDSVQTESVKRQFLLDQVDSLGLDDLANLVVGTTAAGFTQSHLVSSKENDVIGYAPVPLANQRWTVMIAEDRARFTQQVSDLSRGQLINTLILALIVGGLVIFAGRMFETTERESLSDPLTGLANRRFLQEILLRELRRAQRNAHHVSLLILDIDHFKGINDTYGHNVGDEVLEQVANSMLSTVRATDFVIRYGGEEFIVLLPETRLDDALAVADKIRRTIGDTVLASDSRPGITLKATVSVGVATYPRDGQTGEELILRADKALYHAKQNGRNRVSTPEDVDGPIVEKIMPLPAMHR